MFGLFRKLSTSAQVPMTPAPGQLELNGQSWPSGQFWQSSETALLPNPPAIESWLGTLPADSQTSAHTQLQHHWLLHWRDLLGTNYRLEQQDGARLLSALKPELAKQAIAMLTRPQKRISAILGDLVAAPVSLPEVLLVFEHEQQCLSYLQQVSDTPSYRVDGALPHFVCSQEQLFQLEGWIANYLLHAHLLKLELPRWLHEGIVANVQQKINRCQSSCRCGPPQLHQQHLEYWNTQRIQAFWAGSLFDEPEPHGVMAYDLARILVGALAEDWQAFIAFAREAQTFDAGNQAATQVLEVELGRLACAALECDYQADWSPQNGMAAALPIYR